MGHPDQGPRENRPAGEAPNSFADRYLGDGWTEVEPGIYRFEAKRRAAEDEAAGDDLIEAIEPPRQTERQDDDDSQPARRGRWLRR